MTGTEFQPLADGWSWRFYEVDGQAAARLAHAGTEVHFEILPQFRHRVIFRHVTREFLRPLFEEFGFLTTKVPLSDKDSRRFVTRFGFRPLWSDTAYAYFILAALPFEKKER